MDDVDRGGFDEHRRPHRDVQLVRRHGVRAGVVELPEPLVADRANGELRLPGGGRLGAADDEDVADDEEDRDAGDHHADAEREHHDPAQPLARLAALAHAAPPHPREDEQPDHDGEPQGAAAEQPPPEARDVLRGRAVRGERVLLRAAAGEHEGAAEQERQPAGAPHRIPRA